MDHKVQKALIECLKVMDLQADTKTAITLMLRTEPQILTMLDWISKHNSENPDEDRVLRIAQAISEQVS